LGQTNGTNNDQVQGSNQNNQGNDNDVNLCNIFMGYKKIHPHQVQLIHKNKKGH
jgi:hypothetical protein